MSETSKNQLRRAYIAGDAPTVRSTILAVILMIMRAEDAQMDRMAAEYAAEQNSRHEAQECRRRWFATNVGRDF